MPCPPATHPAEVGHDLLLVLVSRDLPRPQGQVLLVKDAETGCGSLGEHRARKSRPMRPFANVGGDAPQRGADRDLGVRRARVRGSVPEWRSDGLSDDGFRVPAGLGHPAARPAGDPESTISPGTTWRTALAVGAGGPPDVFAGQGQALFASPTWKPPS
jgi:hypothetical protein